LGAAKEVARFFDADIVQIEAPQYGMSITAQMVAAKHAAEEITTTPIQHEPVDISRYDLIVLCSPTWWYRPAPPLWSFVENHDFAGKPVFLLMTGNSRLTDERTDKFRTLVEEKHGKFLDRLFIRRGRFYWQKSPSQVHEEVREALEARGSLWPVTADPG
jgi:flavodoxin